MAAEAKRAVRPHPQQPVKCPRCNSSETKFCYYNNYSTAQPRYFCKNCKRYWTDGGTLRNVPVGGGLRKNKRSKAKLAAAALSSSPPSSSAFQQKPSSSTPGILVGAGSHIGHSNVSSHVGLQNPSPDNNQELPHTPGYPLFNPRMFEAKNQVTPLPGQLPIYRQEVNYNHQFVAPPLPMLGELKQHETPLSEAPYFNGYGNSKDHERSISESLQQTGGRFQLGGENSNVHYTTNNFVNVYDWQQVSEGLFGSVGDGNYMYMQSTQPPQWSEFDGGTRL